MTALGFAILDCFTKYLDALDNKPYKAVLSSRVIRILKRSFSWEEGFFATTEELAEEMQISIERIRQLRQAILIILH